MKRFLKELIIFLFGFFLGFGELLYLYLNDIEYKLDSYIIRFFEKHISEIDNEFLKMIPWWAYALVVIIILLILGIIISEFLRIFANTKNVSFLASVLTVLITIIVAVPFARFIMIYIDRFLGDKHFEVYSVIRGILFSILLRLQIYVFGLTYVAMLKKPVKNCCVNLCEAMAGGTYEVKQTLARRLKFEQCFNFIRNYTEDIAPRQFFQIAEKDFLKKTVASWNYYRGGQVMDCSEEQFLHKLYNQTSFAESSIKMKEDKNE